MEKRMQTLFDSRRHEMPSDGLYARIMARIEAHMRRMRIFKLSVLWPIALFSAFLVFVSFQYAAAEFAASGFVDYASLAFSDIRTVIASWDEFALLLAESLPLFGITMLAASLFALLGSIRFIVKFMRSALSSARLA